MDSEVGSGRNRPSDRVIIHKDLRWRFSEKAEAIVGTRGVAVAAEVAEVTLIVAIDLASQWSPGIWTWLVESARSLAGSARSLQDLPDRVCQLSTDHGLYEG